MKNNFNQHYLRSKGLKFYPTHWVLRSFLGQYPKINLNKHKYPEQNILDIGFGDLRNILLFNHCGFKEVFGTETTEEIVRLSTDKLSKNKLKGSLKVGKANNLPFNSNFFDYILASHSCYYVEEGVSFGDNLKEISRVLKKNSYLICSVPALSHDIFQECKIIQGDYAIIKKDPDGLRNGSKVKFFRDKSNIVKSFKNYFYDIEVGVLKNDYFGLSCDDFIINCKKI